MKYTANPVISLLGRPIRLAVVGGGPDSFIGRTHRIAARLDGRYDIVAGVFSADPEKSKRSGLEMGLSGERCYPDVSSMLSSETGRTDGADAIAIMTPNDSHHPYSVAAMKAGFHVLCDKPLANSLEDAEELASIGRDSGLVLCLTHNYSGYPLVRQARAMVKNGDIGELRLVQVEYVHGGAADESIIDDPAGKRGWKFDKKISGPSLVLGDIGTHAHHLLRFVTGEEVTEVLADVGTIVPGRNVHDFAGVLLRMRGGAKGIFWTSRAAAGIENSLKIRVSGSKGTIEWWQELPQRLTYSPLGEPAQIRTANGPGTLLEAEFASRIPAGHPEGFLEAFANIYSDAAEAIAARISGTRPRREASSFPTANDGIEGLRFIRACLESSRDNHGWTRV
jgi:predicted dehydrogenase